MGVELGVVEERVCWAASGGMTWGFGWIGTSSRGYLLAGWFGDFVVDYWSASFFSWVAGGTLDSVGLLGVLIEIELEVVVGWKWCVELISF
jgi:hypothetical protein